MGKQKEKFKNLIGDVFSLHKHVADIKYRLKNVEQSNKELISIVKDLVDRLVKNELYEKNKRERASKELNGDIEVVEARGGFLNKKKEVKNGVQKGGK